MKTIKKLIFFSFFIALAFYLTTFAVTTGSAEGYVKDSQTGEPIDKAKISIVYTESTNIKFELHSDKKGHFYRGGLIPGIYKITVDKEGYVPMQRTIRVPLGDTAKVDFKLEIFESRAPKSSKLSSQASALLNDGKYEQAIGKFTEAISEAPSNPIFYFYRGASFDKIGDTDKALEDYQKSVELKPDFALPIASIGKIYAKKKDFDNAIEFYKKAVELGDQDVITYYNYGVCLMNLGKNTQAKDIFEKLISLDENYSNAYYQLGIIYIGLGDSAKAKELLQKFIDMDPENQNALLAKEILKSLNLP
ncbi:MAG: tetratricopeptide repeat protein [Actinobacteria bacterium]|nr:tetratricopeptide repeat protein [Actinomycetota bacterium]